MKRWIFALVLCLVVPSSVWAQHGMHVGVESDRITIGAEFMPRCPSASSGVLEAGTYDCVEVADALIVPAVEVRVTTLVVLPGATLTVECGATIIGRNVAIDTTKDPFQWGNGLLNFGALRMLCPEKTPFVALAGAASGASFALASEPVGWAAGDALVLPDTRQVTGPNPPRREASTLASIAGANLSLASPLGFTRETIKRPDGSVVLAGRVANLTRRTTIRSENPNGTRWHVAMVGIDASWDVQGVAFVGIGRTRNERLDNTSLGSHIGTNQVGRYAFHIHHTFTSLATRRFVGNAIDGKLGGKWGVAVHQSHDNIIERNVCVDTPGACYSTEDGNEVRNVFRGNFAAYVKGNGVEARENVINGNNCRGCESAFWFGGVGNIIDGNEAWNSQNGIDLFNIFPLAEGVPVPSVKGGPADTTPVLADMVPISMTDNVVAANTDGGSVYWQQIPFPNARVIAVHNALFQVKNGAPNGPSFIYLVDGSLICTGGVGVALGSSTGYNAGVEMLRGEARGCGVGLAGGGGQVSTFFTETVLQNAINIHLEAPQSWSARVKFTRVKHEPLPGHAPAYFRFGQENPWPGDPAPFPDVAGWGYMHGSRIAIEDWQGTGQNYRLLPPASERSTKAWAATNFEHFWTLPPPECGATLGETWDNCGLAYGGEAYATSVAVPLAGVINAVGVPGLTTTLGPPRAILTAPNTNGPAPLGYANYIALYVALTGSPTGADRVAYLSIDSGPTIAATGASASPSWIRHYTLANSDGVHTVRAWRQLNGVEVLGSSGTFRYCVGTCSGQPPPPPPPPNPCVVNPFVPGQVRFGEPPTVYPFTGTLTVTRPSDNCTATVSQ